MGTCLWEQELGKVCLQIFYFWPADILSRYELGEIFKILQFVISKKLYCTKEYSAVRQTYYFASQRDLTSGAGAEQLISKFLIDIGTKRSIFSMLSWCQHDLLAFNKSSVSNLGPTYFGPIVVKKTFRTSCQSGCRLGFFKSPRTPRQTTRHVQKHIPTSHCSSGTALRAIQSLLVARPCWRARSLKLYSVFGTRRLLDGTRACDFQPITPGCPSNRCIISLGLHCRLATNGKPCRMQGGDTFLSACLVGLWKGVSLATFAALRCFWQGITLPPQKRF